MSTGTFLNSSFTAHKHKTLCEKKNTQTQIYFYLLKKMTKVVLSQNQILLFWILERLTQYPPKEGDITL